MKKTNILLIFGNFTFHHFTPSELALFKDEDNDKKCLIHGIEFAIICPTKEDAYKTVEELENTYPAWLIPSEFGGEVACEDFITEKMYKDLLAKELEVSK